MAKPMVMETAGSHTVWQIKWFDKDAFATEDFMTTDEATKNKMVAMCEELGWDVKVTEIEVQEWSEVK